LKDILNELDMRDFNIDLTGFDEKEIENLIPQFNQPNQPELEENIETENECPRCGYKW
jgi:hypothetical protein